MTAADRQYYIDWLLLAYPFKAESYFEKLSDRELVEAYDSLREYM